MGKTQLAPGFRFHPTDVELVRYYLKRKVLGKKLLVDAIAEVDIYKFEPSDLPDMSYIKGGDLKWHFFCPREMKYSTGVRANRSTGCGYWKTTGKERPVLCDTEVVGKIRTLVYHFGKSPRGERTDWVMHEYRLEDKQMTENNIPQDTYVVCVLFKKDGPGPRNGAQYGAPFKEEEWSDKEEHTNVLATNTPANLSGPNKETGLAVASSQNPNKEFFGGMISDSCISDSVPATATTSELPHLSDVAYPPVSAAPSLDAPSLDCNGTATQPENLQAPNTEYDDLYSMLDLFVDEDDYSRFFGPNNNEVTHDPSVSAPVYLEEDDIFRGPPDLSNMHNSNNNNNNNNSMPSAPSFDLIENSDLYLELQDLTAPLAAPHTGNLDLRNTNQGHNFGFSTPAANGDPSGFSAADNGDLYGFPPYMGHGPNL